MLAIMMGVAAGLLSSVMGVGGGVIIVPALIFLFGFSVSTAAGTSLAVIIPTAIMGVLRHQLMGNVQWQAAIMLALGGIVGAYIGPWALTVFPELWLRRGFAVLLVYTAYRMVR